MNQTDFNTVHVHRGTLHTAASTRCALCTQEGSCISNGGEWRTMPAYDIPAPACVQSDFNRDNHLGNGVNTMYPPLVCHHAGCSRCVSCFRWAYSIVGSKTRLSPVPCPVISALAGPTRTCGPFLTPPMPSAWCVSATTSALERRDSPKTPSQT